MGLGPRLSRQAHTEAQKRPHLSAHWALCPSGGIDKVLPFVRLFYGNKLNVAVLTDFNNGQKRKLEGLQKSALLENERIILATEIAGEDEADIEDFFDPRFFVDLVNKTYQLAKAHELTVKNLMDADETTERLVKKAETYFRVLPPQFPEFSRCDSSMYLLHHPELLSGTEDHVVKTLERFEAAFERIGKFI